LRRVLTRAKLRRVEIKIVTRIRKKREVDTIKIGMNKTNLGGENSVMKSTTHNQVTTQNKRVVRVI